MCGWVPAAEDPTQARIFKFLTIRFATLRDFKRASYLEVEAVATAPARLTLPFERKIDVTTQFMDAASLVPSGWVSWSASRPCANARLSHCGIERAVTVTELAPLDRNESAPLLVASFDIECYSATGGFPDAQDPRDAVSMISTASEYVIRV